MDRQRQTGTVRNTHRQTQTDIENEELSDPMPIPRNQRRSEGDVCDQGTSV